MRRMPGPIESRCRLSSSPQAAPPQAAPPQATRPQATRPQATRPKATRPKATRPQAARERRRKPASTITSKFEFRIMANLSRARSSYPIIGTRCPLLRLDPVGPPAAVASSSSGERDRADLCVVRSDDCSTFATPVCWGKIRDLEERVVHYSCGPALHDVRS
jgi:hypothetical protein